MTMTTLLIGVLDIAQFDEDLNQAHCKLAAQLTMTRYVENFGGSETQLRRYHYSDVAFVEHCLLAFDWHRQSDLILQVRMIHDLLAFFSEFKARIQTYPQGSVRAKSLPGDRMFLAFTS